jgi:NitT/TauT family transport system substrate-binding protein
MLPRRSALRALAWRMHCGHQRSVAPAIASVGVPSSCGPSDDSLPNSPARHVRVSRPDAIAPSAGAAAPPIVPCQHISGEPTMCDRYGCVPDYRNLKVDRRSFLKATSAATLTMAVGPGVLGAAQAAGSAIKSTHGTGFCNLNIFLSHAMQLAKEDGLQLDFINTPTFSDQVTFLGMGQVDVGLMPYTSFMALYDAGAPVKIVAGGGIEGCVIVAQAGLDSAEKLKGKTLGTFQLDTLEVMPYDYLKKHGVAFKDVNVRYLGSTPEGVEAFRAGALDWMCTIEPYATALLTDMKGTVKLSDGTDIYGQGYTDCVLACRSDLIKQNPAGLKALIKGMMKAQLMAETKQEEVLSKLVGPYYKTSMENARLAMSKQPAVVDARSQTDFILQRTDSLAEMGYIKKKPGRDAIDWTLLEQVIAENPDLYGQLKHKSA